RSSDLGVDIRKQKRWHETAGLSCLPRPRLAWRICHAVFFSRRIAASFQPYCAGRAYSPWTWQQLGAAPVKDISVAEKRLPLLLSLHKKSWDCHNIVIRIKNPAF